MRAERLSVAGLTLEPLRVDHADTMSAVLADPQLYTFTGGDRRRRATSETAITARSSAFPGTAASGG